MWGCDLAVMSLATGCGLVVVLSGTVVVGVLDQLFLLMGGLEGTLSLTGG